MTGMKNGAPSAIKYRLLWLSALLPALVLGGCQPTSAGQSGTTPEPNQSGDLTGLPAATESVSSESPSPPAVGSAAAPAAPETLPPPPDYPITGIELWDASSSALDSAARAGAYWIRRNALMWSLVEPVEGDRNWAALAGLESEMIAVKKSGSRLILIVRSTPGWAQAVPGAACGPISSDKLAAFAQFMHDIVLKYSTSPYEVKYWELGNEPDIEPSLVPPESIFGCWGDAADPYYGGGYYAEMLKKVYPQIKAADPDAQVLVGGLLLDCDPVNPPEGKNCQPSLFLEGILRAGGGDFFDGISFHGYDYYDGDYRYGNPNWHTSWDTNGPVSVQKSRYVKSLLASYQLSGKFLMNTEAGLLCGKTGAEPKCQTSEFNRTKAFYALESNLAAQAEGLRSNIWYTLYGWRGTALVDDQINPLPAYGAFSLSARQLSGMAVLRTVNEISGVRGYELGRGSRRLMVLWSVDGQEHTYEFESQPAAVFDVFGDNAQNAGKIVITRHPIYIEW